MKEIILPLISLVVLIIILANWATETWEGWKFFVASGVPAALWVLFVLLILK